ncbi:tetratricopeptide repeat protein 14 homolog isoform X2 [Musca domestica]|nr:tetratricopeptide repeat protein 14 homolog isoform X2 [Musca domestica]XP_058974187.1 tetratricopeptide repeat protein 14 homolog isoform X2 [Musca domestica]XP_058974188.1 tetratricopeptide repeat protein 14 homolog isoform X2 [Musca domestica]
MDADLIKKALCFHGKPMQKIWDDERGAIDLQSHGVAEDGNYSIYMERQKHFTFQDRAKRLKLHQFLARKADDLYDKDLGKIPAVPRKIQLNPEDKNNTAIMVELPPYETFLQKNQDKVKRHTLESIKPGDIIYATILKGKSGSITPLVVKPLCTEENNFKLLKDYKIKTTIPAQLCGPQLLDSAGVPIYIEARDYVRCEVVEFSVDAERMTLSLQPFSDKNKNKKLGKITPKELPSLYGKLTENPQSYEQYLCTAPELENPNYDVLYASVGLDVNDNFTLMNNFKGGFPQQEYAKELRQLQASKWAFRSVAEGIEYFKVGQHVEAFQCLNKALNIDPRNVEGLVARGALYANKGSFLKAVEDFEKALTLNSLHVNARKYMGETLVALGRSYEEDNRIQDAAKAYRDCLNIIPNHEQATLLLEAIQHRTGANVDAVPPPPVMFGSSYEQTDKASSASQGSDSDDSSDSESDSEESRPTLYNNSKKAESLSPLSKKLALHAQEMQASRKQVFSQPFYVSQSETVATPAAVVPNEFKLDEDDTETRVRKLLQDASKHKKDKKKSKKSKKAKKAKKSSKDNKDSDEEYSRYEDPMDIQSREHALNENLKLYEKSIQLLKKRQQLLDEQPTTSSAGTSASRKRDKSESPPPAPSFRSDKNRNNGKDYHTIGFGKFPTQTASTSMQHHNSSTSRKDDKKLSFQIKKPVTVDKFGLIRLRSPFQPEKSPTPKSPSPGRSRRRLSPRSRTRSRSRSRSRGYRRSSRSRSKGRSRSRRWHSRSRSRSRGERYASRRRRRSVSRSRSSSYSDKRRRNSRSRSRSLSRGRRRRSPSPLRGRGRRSPSSPSRRSSYRRSRSPHYGRGRGGSRGGRGGGFAPRGSYQSSKFGNRVWKNPNSSDTPHTKEFSSSDGRWPHDKYENTSNKGAGDENPDDPTIEEIDEIISKAQRERKQNIINNDKDILKKPSKW